MKIKINRLINVTFGSRKTCVSTVRVTKTSLLLILTIILTFCGLNQKQISLDEMMKGGIIRITALNGFIIDPGHTHTHTIVNTHTPARTQTHKHTLGFGQTCGLDRKGPGPPRSAGRTHTHTHWQAILTHLSCCSGGSELARHTQTTPHIQTHTHSVGGNWQ